MKTFKIAILSIATCTLLVAQNFPNKGPIPFNSYDQNTDGEITSKEFYDVRAERMTQKANQNMPMRNAQNAPSFEDIDKNGDKKITKEELQDYQLNKMSTRMNNKGMNKGQGMNQGQGMKGQGMNQGQGRGMNN
ncbi:EF-hand domain-containing protein [Malaciobacter marinus]|jgi:Ca2+-binding EF-hand superfamily protein|uniref:EF-hand domain-containing protein n=1 Tax=Malaciobacter marinus TaxID=505249 RepID=UPI0009D2873F|nr:EF-hand domain-containing protein [Malaciobacter marinus]SKB27686.1 EF hand [Malaciobacter marinus]